MGEADKETIIATHFPCSCIKDNETLVISSHKQEVERMEGTPEEVQGNQSEIVQSPDRYSVFYIDTIGGKNAKTKKLFRNHAVKQFKYLCVYGKKGKGVTVEEALRRDGRFIDNLKFDLSDNDEPDCLTKCTQTVDNLHGKRFKIQVPLNMRASLDSNMAEILSQKGIRAVTRESGSSDDMSEIYELLCQQFADLKEWMESRFPGDYYENALNLRKEDFGKIQQSFSEVHRVRKLIKMSESVCKVVFENVSGTGFVLFDNFILTNAHLFRGYTEGERLKEGITVYALFNYDDPEPHTKYTYFELADSYITYSHEELDYAILELKPEGHKVALRKMQPNTIKVPPGLLEHFAPMPPNGEACVIGHPGGEVKKMDFTYIIEKEGRSQAYDDHLGQFKDTLFTLCSVHHLSKAQGIENIMKGGTRADNVATYNTFMYHGSSGSPVFDGQCKLFGLHTSGYVYGFANETQSVIELAQPLLTIFEHFVSKMKERGCKQMLERIQEEAKGNTFLEVLLVPRESSHEE